MVLSSQPLGLGLEFNVGGKSFVQQTEGYESDSGKTRRGDSQNRLTNSG